jgi:type I restriction enzyme S subunit
MSCVALKDYQRATYSGFLKRLRPIKDGVTDEKYMGFYLRSSFFRKCMNNNAIMTLRASLNEEIFSYLYLYLPEIDTQKKLGDFLYFINRKIENNKKHITKLEDLSRLIYGYWFQQFDFPNHENKPYRINGGRLIENKNLKYKIPEGWDVVKLTDLVEWISGAQPAKSTFIYKEANGYVRFIQNRDYSSDGYKTYIKESKNNKLCDEYDILMDKYGDAGSVRFGLAGAYNVALSKIKVNLPYGQEYIRNYLKSKPIYTYLKNACMASTRASLNGDNLDFLFIPIPPVDILRNYEMINKDIINKMLVCMSENRKLVQIREWLSPMAINGQLSIT